MMISKLISLTRTGLSFTYRRWRHKTYWQAAAGRLSRELELPLTTVDDAISKAVKVVSGLSASEHAQRWLLGGVSAAEFLNFVDEVGKALPTHLRAELARIPLELPHGDADITRRFNRAMRHVIAGSEDDVIANQILTNGEGAARRRKQWSTVTWTVTGGVIGAALGGTLITALQQQPTTGAAVASVIAGLAAGGVAAIAAAYDVGGHVVGARQALDRLFEALLAPNAPRFEPLTASQIIDGVSLDDQVRAEVARLMEAAGYGSSTQATGPPARERLYRFDSEERERIRSALDGLAHELGPLKLDPGWETPRRLADAIDRLLSRKPDARTSSIEVELEQGVDLVEALLYGSALAETLDQAASPASMAEAA